MVRRQVSRLCDAILGRGELDEYHLAHSARADLCRRLGRWLTRARRTSVRWPSKQEPERSFLEKRLRELPPS
jgi:RNA polymerase sigma-70 factor (ECF subfamily)